MDAFQTIQPGGERLNDEIVARVGAAAGRVAQIQQEYSAQARAETEPDAREALAVRARGEAERAIDAEGISIADYNQVLGAAEQDQDLEQRLLEAAREVM